jgi:hypothetical protein
MPDLNDFYPSTAGGPSTAVQAPQGGPMLAASGSVAQSASGSVSLDGQPALWFLALVGAAMIVWHFS